jgi:hypothetical protein
MVKLTKVICVWLDSYSDPESPAWVVSLDELGPRGLAETTHTLYMREDEDEAMTLGREAARKHGLPLYRTDDGLDELIASAEEVAED